MKGCTYLLPLRRAAFSQDEAQSLAVYFAMLGDAGCEVVVIDGSDDGIFDSHGRAWRGICRHEKVDRRFGYLNDKTNAIHTGIEITVHEKVILADDDIRYNARQIAEICAQLDFFHVVRPQNFLRPVPWWAAMEASRMLINRATLRTADYSGTCAFRRSAFLRVGPYDGDVLFDNEEMIRHFARAGLKIDYRADCFVQKKPPSFRKWLEQRPRQAYEDFALRVKTVSFASIIPVGIALAVFWPVQAFSLFSALIAAVSIALALAGWSRGEARKCFPIVACLFAPFWILERAVSTYCAFGWYLFRGGYPFAGRVLSRGVGRDWFAVRDSGPKTELNFGSGDHVLSGEEKQRCRATKRGFGRLNRGGAFVS